MEVVWKDDFPLRLAKKICFPAVDSREVSVEFSRVPVSVNISCKMNINEFLTFSLILADDVTHFSRSQLHALISRISTRHTGLIVL